MNCSKDNEKEEGKKKFVEIIAASTIFIFFQWLLEALAGFLCFKFFETLWDKYVKNWWNKMWGIDGKSSNED